MESSPVSSAMLPFIFIEVKSYYIISQLES